METETVNNVYYQLVWIVPTVLFGIALLISIFKIRKTKHPRMLMIALMITSGLLGLVPKVYLHFMHQSDITFEIIISLGITFFSTSLYTLFCNILWKKKRLTSILLLIFGILIFFFEVRTMYSNSLDALFVLAFLYASIINYICDGFNRQISDAESLEKMYETEADNKQLCKKLLELISDEKKDELNNLVVVPLLNNNKNMCKEFHILKDELNEYKSDKNKICK